MAERLAVIPWVFPQVVGQFGVGPVGPVEPLGDRPSITQRRISPAR